MPIQEAGKAKAGAADERRVALVIGNGGYLNASTLTNPPKDASAIVKVLTDLHFEVIEGLDQTVSGMDEKISLFADRIKNADAALLFYAGHGLQVNGENYLVPVDAELDNEGQLNRQTIKLQDQLDMMDQRAKISIVLLDCCRDNPFVRSLYRGQPGKTKGLGITRGLARMEITQGSFIAFATAPGTVALDGEGGHSPFTAALLDHIKSPGMSINDIMTDVTSAVLAATDNQQVPWCNSSLSRRFSFNPLPSGLLRETAVLPPPEPTPIVKEVMPSPSPVGKLLGHPADRTIAGAAGADTVAGGALGEAEGPLTPPSVIPDIVDPPKDATGTWGGKGIRIALLAVVIGVAAVPAFIFLDRLGARLRTPSPPNYGEASQKLVARIDSPAGWDDGLRNDVVSFLVSAAPDDLTRNVIHTLVAMAQFHIMQIAPSDPVPDNCRAPTPVLRPGDLIRTVVCAGLDLPGQQRLVSILAALPATLWAERVFGEQIRTARLAVADLDAEFTAKHIMDRQALDLLKRNLGLGSRRANPVTLQFAGNFQRGNAQAIMDRLVSFGWHLGGVQRDGGAAGLNEIRYGSQALVISDAAWLSDDLVVQGLTVTPNPNAAITTNQLDIYISTPLALWVDQQPQFAWCYQEYDPSKGAGTRYLVACHPSQSACANARGNPTAKRQSPCLFREDLGAGGSVLRAGGWANSWFAEGSTEFESPFPAVPQ
ncbi:caspase domain-containing protein [Mesorhizobium sp. B2-4-17]|uniref:caspase family protein n=1 Tax=Mesorhizobium sp. B2-4-17 TaxID=2589932 RepID=UPI0015E3825C|nr:caspase domain-containing protein [Mesorhizobium sp. B2-4-17]